MHPETAASFHNLATLYDAQGKSSDAEALFKRALIIFEQTLGETHPNTQRVRERYVSLLRKLRRDQEADEVEGRGRVPDDPS